MKSEFNPRFAAWLLAGLVSISAGVEAADGFSITRSRENAISTGMSMTEVGRLLGRPARTAQYGNTPGPVWTYRVVDPLFGRTEFNVDFGADNRVISAGEVVVGSDSPNGGQRD